MSDTYVPSFFSDDPRTGALTYGQLEARRRIAAALATRNRAYPKTIGEGLSALGEGLGEGYMMRGLERAEGAQRNRDLAAGSILTGGTLAAPPAAAPGPVSQAPEVDPQTMALAATGVEQKLAQSVAPPPPNADLVPPWIRAAAPNEKPMTPEELVLRLKRNESGGHKDPYRAIGPVSRRGDYPYGAYQVMGENIPKWTKSYLGREMTPQEFLLDDKAQDQLARAKSGEYLNKYGPTGAAAAWFAGEKGMQDPKRKDTLGTHVAEYVRRFNIPLVSREQVVRSAARAPGGVPEQPAVDEGAVPPEATPAAAPARQDIAAAMAQRQAPQQQLAQAGQPSMPSGVAPPAVPPTVGPQVTPQMIPKAPPRPEQPIPAGPEPKLETFVNDPRLKQQMDAARRIALDPQYSPSVQAQAQQKYKDLQDLAKDAYTKQWTVWHERDKVEQATRLGRDKQDLETTRLRGQAEDEAETRVLKQRLGGQEPQKFFDNLKTEQSSAEVASRMMGDNQLIIKAVKDGVIMGTGAGWRLNAAKLASWALQNGYASEQAANTEIARALAGSRIREAMSQINPSGPASNVDLLISRQLSGTEPTMEPKSFMQLLHKSNNYNAKVLNDFEDKRDYYLSGTRAERQFSLNAGPTAPQARVDEMLANRDNKAMRAAYDDQYGEGASALEIERFKRRQRRGQ